MNKKQMIGLLVACVLFIVTGVTSVFTNVVSEKMMGDNTKQLEELLSGDVTFNAPLTVPPELIPHNNETNKAKPTPKYFEYIENQPNLLTKTLNDILESNPSFFTPIAFLFYGDFTDAKVNPTIKMGDYEFTLMRDKDIIQNGILDMVRDSLKWLYNKIRKVED
jgi:ABC-type antimicrobial peptide transport system permease subunit